MILKILLGAL